MNEQMPPEYIAFLLEYESLCKRHGLMVFSEGEQVCVGSYEAGLWRIVESTIDKYNRVTFDAPKIPDSQ